MKHRFYLLAVCFLMAACTFTVNDNNQEIPEGAAVTTLLDIGADYEELLVGQAFEVTVSDTATVATATLDSALLDRLEVRTEGRTLRIGLKSMARSQKSVARVVLPPNSHLTSIGLSGAASFTSTVPLRGKEVNVKLSGASTFQADICGDEVEIETSGASHCTAVLSATEAEVDMHGASTAALSGTCASALDIDMSGAASLDADKLDTRRTEGRMSGSSTATVCCCESLQVALSGASHLTYDTPGDGCAPEIDCRTSGAATVMRR